LPISQYLTPYFRTLFAWRTHAAASAGVPGFFPFAAEP
jgi:hypothetical protein